MRRLLYEAAFFIGGFGPRPRRLFAGALFAAAFFAGAFFAAIFFAGAIARSNLLAEG
jgi:hypothetical protein